MILCHWRSSPLRSASPECCSVTEPDEELLLELLEDELLDEELLEEELLDEELLDEDVLD